MIRIERLLVVLILITLSFTISGCGTGAFQIQAVPTNQELKESVLTSDAGFFVSDKIAIIDVDGIITNRRQDSWMRQGNNPVSLFQEKLDKAARDKDVKAVVLRLNSPGGGVAASDMMYHSLKEFKRKTKKPVIAAMMDVACSGAYYLACGTDGIVAQRSCVTGSIGVIMQTFSIKGTMEKIGVKSFTIKSGKMKDLGSPMHDLSKEEEEILQGLVMSFYEQFLDVIREGRPALDNDRLRTLADGRVYTTNQALKEGLIDRIGYPDDAIKWAKELAGVEKCETVIYHRPLGYKPNIYAASDITTATTGALINVEMPSWLNAGQTQFLYMWQPR